MPDGYLTTKQVAKLHNVTSGCVTKWIKSNKNPLPAEKVNQIYLIRESDARAYKPSPITGRPPKK